MGELSTLREGCIMIADNVHRIRAELPPGVELVGAAKTRTPLEILEAVDAGLRIVGENYVQEAERAYAIVGTRATWHLIGHLQTNKARKAVRLFDMIETVDSRRLAQAIDTAASQAGKVMPILIEINSGQEAQKNGVLIQDAPALIREIVPLPHVRIMGLMTMGPLGGEPEDYRPYFRRTRKLFEALQRDPIPGAEMRYLSMGMSDSYRIALEEGANLVRIGTRLFGTRIT